MSELIEKIKLYITDLKDALSTVIAGDITLYDILIAFLIILVTLIFQRLIAKVLLNQLKILTSKTKSTIDNELIDSIEKPIIYFILLMGMYMAVTTMPLKSDLESITDTIFRGGTTFIIVWALMKMVNSLTKVMARNLESKGSTVLGFIPLINKSLRILIVIVGAILVMDNLGYSVGGVLTTLGLGGAAFAFAAKDTIANIYGSLSLVLDRPFKIGDWIIVGDKIDGDVESIGFRSTKIRTFPKTQLTIPNNYLANQVIDNWGRMPKRRVKQVVGVRYDTSPEQMEGLVNDIRELLKEDEGVDKSFIMVQFTDFNESSLDILVYYFTKDISWVPHMQVRERINLKIMRAVENRGTSIAFPTRTIHIQKDEELLSDTRMS